MIVLRDLLARMQSQAADCIAVVLVNLNDGTATEACGENEATTAGAVAQVMSDLLASQHIILPRIPAPAGASAPEEAILVSDDRTYVCRRVDDPPHHAVTAICGGTRSLGLIVGLLRQELMTEDRI